MRLKPMPFTPIAAALTLGIAALVSPADSPAVCKWVDENGVVHFADVCPEDAGAMEMELAPEPTEEQVQAARERYARSKPGDDPDSVESPGAYRSLPYEQLGPLPDNSRSTYLETVATAVLMDMKGGEGSDTGRLHITLKGTASLPKGSLVEVHFPNPRNPSRKNEVARELPREGATLRFQSPSSKYILCWNYPVDVLVYSDKRRGELLGTHQQIIQSRIDIPLLREHPGRMEGMLHGGVCPGAQEEEMRKMSLSELGALCEAAREHKLAPQRERHVENCVESGRDRGYCERYYAGWGDAQRISPVDVIPALFYDLPECLAWKEAGGDPP